MVILWAQERWRALRPLGLRVIPLGQTKIQRGTVLFRLGFVKLQLIAEAPAVNISPLEMIAIGAATSTAQSPGVTVQTSTGFCSWADRLPIPMDRLRNYADSHAVVRVHLRVSYGRIGISILDKEGTDFGAGQMVPAGTAVNVSLGIPRLDGASALIISDWNSHGRSLVDVESISISPYAVPASR